MAGCLSTPVMPASADAFALNLRMLSDESSCYDRNGNLLGGGGRTYTWNPDNQPTAITGSDWVVEAYAYDAEGTRVLRTREGAATAYVGGLYEQDLRTGTERLHYAFAGDIVAQRAVTGGWGPLVYLHGDHLGSVSVATSESGAVVSRQDFTPWGEVRTGGVGETTRNFTGQRKDGTGLLFYNARYYDPGLGRFLSADSIVPGAAAGSGGGAATLGYDDAVALTPLTVDFHEPGFAAGVGAENAFTLDNGFSFQLGGEARQQVEAPDGPSNPQALNRYAYTLNNPVRYTDPTGHCPWCFGALAGAAMGASGYLGSHRGNATVGGMLKWMAIGAVAGGVTVGLGAPLVMRLAAQAATADSVRDKLYRYLLNPDHPKGGDKAAWFSQALGYSRENMSGLAKQIRFDPSKAFRVGSNQQGVLYNQWITIEGANGRKIDVLFAWIRLYKDDIPRLVTAIPSKK